MTLHSLYDAVRDGTGSGRDIALSTGQRDWSFRALLAAAEALAMRLAPRVEPGDAVSLQVTDPVAAAVATLGCDLVQVCLLRRDPSAPNALPGRILHDGLAHAPRDGEAQVLGTPGLWLRSDGPLENSPVRLPRGAQVFFTSGSTGEPVGVVRSVRSILADAFRVSRFLGYAPDHPVVSAAPLFHAYGFNYGLVGPLLAGAPLRCIPARSVPSQLDRAVSATGARTLIALPAHYGLLSATSHRDAYPGLNDLRSAVSAGAPLGVGTTSDVVRRHRIALYNCYGSSEAGAVTLVRLEGDEDSGYIGAPLPGVSVHVDDSQSSRGTGELMLRSTSLAEGRLLTADHVVPLTDEDGWYRTGDLARLRQPQGIDLVGRMSTAINVAGEKVSPSEIERVLTKHPHVLDAVVTAAPDSARGQVPVARVVLRLPTPPDELLGWCRTWLAPHAVPRRVEPVAEIARSATGKALWSEPRKRAT
ncbi:class I adenylate-forming enzyme family protein [Streptomyces sp. NPDC056004]|uniref:class I adenylate-forming enzyme family protein n=1 Tax=Streptomyces sp. NPDC056004 TaxID=3345677 RepID=UPI0035D62BD5